MIFQYFNQWLVVILLSIIFSGLVAYIITHLRIQTLEKSNRQLKVFRELMDQTNECVLLLDEQGIIIEVNQAFVKMIDKSEERLKGKSVLHLQSDFDFHEHRQRMLKSFADNGYYNFSLNLFVKKETFMPLNVRVSLIKIDNNRYYGITACSNKILSEKESIISEKNDELFEIQHLANIGYWEMNYLTKTIYWSKELYSLLGYQENEVEPNLDFIHFMAHQDDQSRVWKAFLNAFQAQEKVDIHYRLKNHQGETLEIFLRIRHFFSETNEHIRTIGMIQDISEQIELKEELDLQQIYTEAILSNSHLIFVSFTNHFIIVSVNKLMTKLCGLSEEDLEGESLMSAFGNLSRHHRKLINENLDFKRPLPLKDHAGKIHYVQWDHSTIELKDGQILNLLLGLDVTETINQRKALEEALLTDSITGLPNRRKLNKLLVNYFYHNGERTDKPLTLLCIAVDPIAEIGDLYGQSIEDEVLKNLSLELNKQIGKFGLLAKTATDQFCFFLPDGDENKIVGICNNINKVFNEQFYNKRYNVNLRPFIGIAKFPQQAKNREDLLRFASVAMREAKSENKNVINFSDDDCGKVATLRT